MDASHQEFFLQHLITLARDEPINAATDIFDARMETRLAVSGEKIAPEMLRKLMQIELSKPIVSSICFLDPLTIPAIKLHMQKSLAQSPGINLLLQATYHRQRAQDCLNLVSLPLPLINLLTVMSRQFPSLYEHSLDVALISACLSLVQQREIADPVQLIYIGLFHDVGSLFLDPSLLDSGRSLSWTDWRQIYTHPTVGYDVLKDIQGLPPNIALAVLQHHERLDGSGYPNGLAGSDIGDLARITAVAEVVASVMRNKSKDYLNAVLNANSGKLDGNMLDTLRQILAGVSGDEFVAVAEHAATLRLVDIVSDAVTRWHALGPEITAHRALHKVRGSLATVEKILRRSGFSAEQLSTADASLDLQFSPEVSHACREARYQLGQVLHEVHRNKPAYMAIQPKEASAAFGRWVVETQRRLAAVAEDEAEEQRVRLAEAELKSLRAQPSKPSAQWYYLKGQKKHGPISQSEAIENIQRGILLPDDMVWCSRFAQWRPVREVAELYSAAAKLTV